MSEAVTYIAAHKWVHKNSVRTGRCTDCGREGWTDWAYLRWPAPYRKDLADFREMCRSCHQKLDYATGQRVRRYVPLEERKTHCTHGHLYDAENTYFRKDRPGARQCKACGREVSRRQYLKRKARGERAMAA